MFRSFLIQAYAGTPIAAARTYARGYRGFVTRLCVAGALHALPVLGTLATVSVVRAQPEFELSLPLDCVPGTTCWVVHHVDTDAGPAARDYRCGRLTYEGHRGTDFAIRDLVELERGVAVRAAADGVVKATRDSVPDVVLTSARQELVAGRECGNGVVVEHNGDWTTQYCHLRQDSVAVRRGMRVQAGQRLGMVGLSGRTEFPHLHFAVRHHGQVVDPFTTSESAPCGTVGSALWRKETGKALAYRAFMPYNVGFSAMPVTGADVRAGKYRDAVLSPSSPALVFWADSFGVRPGDRLTLRIRSPSGAVLVEHTKEYQRHQIRSMQFVGKKRGDRQWATGRYVGEVITRRREAPAGESRLTVPLRIHDSGEHYKSSRVSPTR